MKVQVSNVQEFKDPEKLIGGCDVRIVSVVDYEDTGRSKVEYEIISPVVPGKGPAIDEAQGRKIFDFVLFDLSKAVDHKDGGKFATRMVVQLCNCFGLDPEDFDTQDFTGQEGRVWVFEGENKDTKRSEIKITKFYPQPE